MLRKEGQIEYRKARYCDIDELIKFVDYEMSRRDCFVTAVRHRYYIKHYTVILAICSKRIIGWAVKQRDGTMIHLLVAKEKRSMGIGRNLVEMLDASRVRSKCDQKTGDPRLFYKRLGYVKLLRTKLGKHKNIDLLVRRQR